MGRVEEEEDAREGWMGEDREGWIEERDDRVR